MKKVTSFDSPDGGKVMIIYTPPTNNTPQAAPAQATPAQATPAQATKTKKATTPNKNTLTAIKEKYFKTFDVEFTKYNKRGIDTEDLSNEAFDVLFRSYAILKDWYKYKFDQSKWPLVIKTYFPYWWYFYYNHNPRDNFANLYEDFWDWTLSVGVHNLYRPAYGNEEPDSAQKFVEATEILRYWNANKKYLYPKALADSIET
jgi:hypothetical protein